MDISNIHNIGTVRQTFRGFVNILFPPFCPICDENIIDFNGRFEVCDDCEREMTRIGISCRVCGIPFEKTFGDRKAHRESQTCGDCLVDKKFFKMSRSAVEYSGSVRRAVSSFKYENGFHFERFLSNLIADRAIALEDEQNIKFDIIIPVPLHRARLIKRCYNQSLLLSNSIAKRIFAKVDSSSLVRIKDTTPQVGLKPKDRRANVKGAFKVEGRGDFKGKKVLIVDDVYTTGATMNECAKVLSVKGSEVYALTVARTVVDN